MITLRADVRYLRKAILSELYQLQQNDLSPSQEQLANRLGCHRNTIGRNITALEALGYIRVIWSHGRGVTAQYELLSPAYEELNVQLS